MAKHFCLEEDALARSSTARISRLIAATARRLIDDIEPLCDSSEVLELKKFFDSGGSPNYDRFAYAFARSFLLPNYWKMLGVFKSDPFPLPRIILDAGCGPGAASLACLAWIESCLFYSKTHLEVRIICIDKSIAQLRVARKLIESAALRCRWLKVRPSFICLNLSHIESVAKRSDCVILSHVLTENFYDVGSLLGSCSQVLVNPGVLYIVERVDDSVWHQIDASASRLALPRNSGVAVAEDCAGVDSRWTSLPLQARFTVLRSPYLETLPVLVRRYFAAWNEQSEETIAEIFSLDAEYREKPFSEPLKGLREIREYWLRRVLSQHMPEARIINVAYSGREAFIEWEAAHGLEGRRTLIKGAMVIVMDSSTNKIESLREYFRTNKRISQ